MKRPVLRYFGGKFRLAPWIISNFPEHRIYVEPFGGAASVLMQKPRSYAEVYNDLDDGVYSLFKCLQDPSKASELGDMLERTPFSRREFELAHIYHPHQLESARRMIIRSFMGFGADSVTNIESKTGFRSNSNRSGTTPAHDWVNYSKSMFQFTDRLQGVVIENRDAFDLIKTHDSKDTLFYLDPPYHHDTRRGGRYKFEMTNEEHEHLISIVKGLWGKVCISGYESSAYDKLDWRKVTKESRADGAKKTLEVLWMNYKEDLL